MERLFWDGWQGPARVVAMALLSYVFLIALLRATGKRTLSKMNAFDFIVTIASGSTFATVLLSKEVNFAEGAAAFTMLVLMQYGVAWASARSARFESLVKSRPRILVWRGELLREELRRARVTPAEILAACREAGLASLDEVEAIVLETAGEFSVLRREAAPVARGRSTLRTVAGAPQGPGDDPPT